MQMPLIVIRESKTKDANYINEVVRKGYLTNVTPTWLNALFKEITFQLMVTTSAIMFIFLGFPFVYCVSSIPLVITFIYLTIYSTYLMKATELVYKRPAHCWVAEACEPFLFLETPEAVSYRLTTETNLRQEGIDMGNYRRKVIGTVAVCKSFNQEDTAWLYRLVVEKSYRRKGVGSMLIKKVQDWCVLNGFSVVETAMSECQDYGRGIFANRGFLTKQMYHKKVVGSLVTYLMYHLECDLKTPQLQL